MCLLSLFYTLDKHVLSTSHARSLWQVRINTCTSQITAKETAVRSLRNDFSGTSSFGVGETATFITKISVTLDLTDTACEQPQTLLLSTIPPSWLLLLPHSSLFLKIYIDISSWVGGKSAIHTLHNNKYQHISWAYWAAQIRTWRNGGIRVVVIVCVFWRLI